MNRKEVRDFARHPETRSFVAIPFTLFVSLICFFFSLLFLYLEGKYSITASNTIYDGSDKNVADHFDKI